MNLFSELKRRNVFRVAAAYIVLSWILLQVTDVVAPVFELPDSAVRMIFFICALGFLPALIFSWIYELTPEGVRKESDIDRSQSITQHTGRKLDVAVIVLAVVAIGLFGLDRAGMFESRDGGETPSAGFEGDRAASRSATGGITTGDDAVGEELSVAVLPFANMSADADNEYFADGISEEILNLLADVRDLSVASRTSAFAFKGKDTPIPEIASTLKVRYVLEGSVRKAGDQVRVTAQLIDAETDRHLWSETFDRTLQDIFAIQDEIAAAIGEALQVELLGDSGESVAVDKIDPDIYSLFLQARHTMRLRGGENIRKATEMLIKVVEAEPDFARAHLLLGEAYLLANDQGAALLPEEIARAQARMHAEIARRIDPDLAGIYLIMGSLAGSEGDMVVAIENYGRAIELEPSEPRPYHWRALNYRNTGFLKEAFLDAREAVRLEPGNVGARGALALAQVSLGDFEGAFENMDWITQLGSAVGHDLKGMLFLMSGEFQAARQSFDSFLESADRSTAWYELLIDIASGERAPADLLNEIETETYLSPDLGPTASRQQMLGALLALGLYDEYLSQPLEVYTTFSFFRWGERFQSMRADSRFVRIMEHLGIADFWRVHGPPPDCRVAGESFTCGHGYPDGYAVDVNR